MSWIRAAFAICIAGLALAAGAQQPQQPNPMDVVPDKMPNDIPYGTPVTLERAQAAINAAVAESNKRGWKLNVAVVDSGANLVAFARMDGAQIGSIALRGLERDAGAAHQRHDLRLGARLGGEQPHQLGFAQRLRPLLVDEPQRHQQHGAHGRGQPERSKSASTWSTSAARPD